MALATISSKTVAIDRCFKEKPLCSITVLQLRWKPLKCTPENVLILTMKFTMALKAQAMIGEKKCFFFFPYSNSHVNIDCMRLSETSMKLGFSLLLQLIEFICTYIWGIQSFPSKHINVETTLIVNVYQRCFNVDIWLKMKVELFQRWYLVENESWAHVCLSTLFQRWQNNVLKQCW